MSRLEGKVAIITGGNSGVGAATAKLFAKEGAKVVISARREAQLKDVADAIREAGGEVLPVVTDISKKGDADMLVAKAVEAYGKVDILINNAGVLEDALPFTYMVDITYIFVFLSIIFSGTTAFITFSITSSLICSKEAVSKC